MITILPGYPVLDPQGNQITPIRGYNLDSDGFVEFLKSGLK